MKLKSLSQIKLSVSSKKILSNISWLLFESLIRFILSFVVSVYVARYLGPEGFGNFNYALAIIAILVPLTYLGLNGIAVQELVINKENKNEILGTLFVLRVFSAVMAILGVLIFSILFEFEIKIIKIGVIISSFSLLFQSFDVIDFWFQSILKSKFSVYSRMISLLISSIIKIILIYTNSDLIYFFFVYTFEIFLLALFYNVFYKYKEDFITRWSFKLAAAKNLLAQSWPLLLSSFGIIIYLKVDKIMIGTMLNSHEVGIYSVASKITELWNFLPILVVTSFFPAIIKSKQTSKIEYKKKLINLILIITWSAIVLSVIIALLAHPIIYNVYGNEFESASSIVIVHIWTLIFIFWSQIVSKYLIVEKVFIFSIIRHFSGATIDVILNYLLIPIWGGEGAAIATVISFGVSSYFICFFFKFSRPLAILLTKSLNIFNLINLIKEFGLIESNNKKD